MFSSRARDAPDVVQDVTLRKRRFAVGGKISAAGERVRGLARRRRGLAPPSPRTPRTNAWTFDALAHRAHLSSIERTNARAMCGERDERLFFFFFYPPVRFSCVEISVFVIFASVATTSTRSAASTDDPRLGEGFTATCAELRARPWVGRARGRARTPLG